MKNIIDTPFPKNLTATEIKLAEYIFMVSSPDTKEIFLEIAKEDRNYDFFVIAFQAIIDAHYYRTGENANIDNVLKFFHEMCFQMSIC